MNRLHSLLLICCLFFLQGCFEIVETLTLNTNGSGKLQLVINMSKSKTRLNSVMKMKTANGHKVPQRQDIIARVSSIEKTLKASPGLSSVKTSLDFENYIGTLDCLFSDIASLNNAIRMVASSEKVSRPLDDMYGFDEVTGVFNRFHKFLWKNQFEKMRKADKEIFANANYTSIFRFQKIIASSSDKSSKVSADKKAIMLKVNMLDLVSNKRTIQNKITLSQ